MTTLARAGKWLFVATFGVFGLIHFAMLEYTAQAVPAMFGAPVFWASLTGAAQLAFVAAVALGRYDRLAALLLALMLAVFVATVHLPEAIAGDPKGWIAVFRDMGMAGAALMFAEAFSSSRRFAGGDVPVVVALQERD